MSIYASVPFQPQYKSKHMICDEAMRFVYIKED